MSFLDRHLIVDGSRIAYRDRGDGEPVVFIHGTPSYSHEWRHVVPGIEAAGYRVITYDLLGYGDSERPLDKDTSVGGQTELLGHILDALGVERATIVSHDIGGAIGQRFALFHPDRVARLMLMDTVSYDSWPSETWQTIREHIDEYVSISPQEFEQLLTKQLRMTVEDQAAMEGPELDAFLWPHRTGVGRASFFQHQVSHYDSTYTQEIAGRLGELTAPVRILWGEHDRWQPLAYAHRLLRDLPNASLAVLPGAGHFLMEDDPEWVAREVLDFLRDGER
ncbi:alpha/beta hydrolase [Microbacterium sp. NPDC096154]|uniref:alpha/beta fold hydrolase n=1 Tax=Microbacterium sp. NPDC096154 TaxID=3155549 RepID=UPI0033201E1B